MAEAISPTRIQHHLPSDVGDLFGSQAGLDRQQDQDPVFGRGGGSGPANPSKALNVFISQDFGLLCLPIAFYNW